jgi:hypothetical protein
MFKISLTECLIIGIVTVICGFFIQHIVTSYGEEDSKDNNFFCRNKGKIWFYTLLFIIGVSIHVFITYIDIANWECEKVCVDNMCKIICIIPINNITNMLVTK